MNLETRTRDAVEALRTPVDVEDGLRRLHRTRQRRTAGKVLAVATAVAVCFGVVQLTSDRDSEVPPASPNAGWVLVTGNGLGADDNPQPKGDEWAEPLVDDGVQDYPDFRDASPATRRFLVSVDYGIGHAVMTPGRREPLINYPCGDGCFGAALGPGPDELTVVDENFRFVVIGPDGGRERDLGPAQSDEGNQIGGPFAWSPDGSTMAASLYTSEASTEGGPPTRASVSLALLEPDGTTNPLYEYSEPVPAWYVPDPFGPGAYNGWGSPWVTDLEWAPDSRRLAFVTMTVADSEDEVDAYELTLLVADAETGSVAEIADLGRCGSRPTCDSSIAWTPDGKRLTVLANSKLTDYDPTGRVLDSQPTEMIGPLAWLESE